MDSVYVFGGPYLAFFYDIYVKLFVYGFIISCDFNLSTHFSKFLFIFSIFFLFLHIITLLLLFSFFYSYIPYAKADKIVYKTGNCETMFSKASIIQNRQSPQGTLLLHYRSQRCICDLSILYDCYPEIMCFTITYST